VRSEGIQRKTWKLKGSRIVLGAKDILSVVGTDVGVSRHCIMLA
jgi:hypothetical protein